MQSQPAPAAGVRLTRKAERYLADHPKAPGPQHLSRRDHKALAKLRAEAEEQIERLIEFVDRIEGEPDLEDADEDDDRESEPSLGWAGGRGCSLGTVPNAFFVDCELDDANDEPSLGVCERHPSHYSWSARNAGGSQIGWAHGGNTRDLEGDAHEDDEPGGDEEPSLGWETGSIGRVMVDGDAIWPDQTQARDPGIDQTWISGRVSEEDLEGEFDGREDGADLEPNLGSPSPYSENANQVGWASGGDQNEREDDHAEKFGIGDLDGLLDPDLH
jgi:hypothetical protein